MKFSRLERLEYFSEVGVCACPAGEGSKARISHCYLKWFQRCYKCELSPIFFCLQRHPLKLFKLSLCRCAVWSVKSLHFFWPPKIKFHTLKMSWYQNWSFNNIHHSSVSNIITILLKTIRIYNARSIIIVGINGMCITSKSLDAQMFSYLFNDIYTVVNV